MMDRTTFRTIVQLLAVVAAILALHCFDDTNPAQPGDTTTQPADSTDTSDSAATVQDSILALADTSTALQNVVVTSAGGTYELDGGLTVTVPLNAVAGDTTFSIRRVGSNDADSLFSLFGLAATDIYGAVEGKPDGMAFTTPITISFKAPVEPGEYPSLYEFDTELGTVLPALGSVELDPDSNLVTMTLSHFSGKASAKADENTRGKEDCAKEPCKCGKIKTKAKSRTVTCEDKSCGCQIIEVEEEVNYIDCGTTFQSTRTEISPGCKPKMTLTADKQEFCREADAIVTADLFLGCPSKLLPGVEVTFNVTGPAELSAQKATTDAKGQAIVTVRATCDPGDVKVDASATAEYYLSYTHVSFAGAEEKNYGDKMSGTATKDVSLTVVEPTLTVSPASPSIDKGKETEVTATISCAEKQEAGTVVFSVSPDLGTVEPSSVELAGNSATTTFTGTETGTATITATFTPSDGCDDVTGTGTVEIRKPYYTYHVVLDCNLDNAPNGTCESLGSSCGFQAYATYTGQIVADILMDSATIATAENTGVTSQTTAQATQSIEMTVVDLNPPNEIIPVTYSLVSASAGAMNLQCLYNWYSLELSDFQEDTVHFSFLTPTGVEHVATYDVKATLENGTSTTSTQGIYEQSVCGAQLFSFPATDSAYETDDGYTESGCLSMIPYEGTYTLKVTRTEAP